MNISKIHTYNNLNTFSKPNQKDKDVHGFEDELSNALTKLNDSQTIVNTKQQQVLKGEISAHELTTTVAESQLALKLATSISSKLISSIQEITNMQI